MSDALVTLGWDDEWASAFRALDREDLLPGRVVMEHPHHLRVTTAEGEMLTRLAGRLRHQAKSSAELPAVGDWVGVRPPRHEGDLGQVEALLPRRTRLTRRLPGRAEREQVLAANIDTVFLVAGLDADLNIRRLERFLTAARQSGAETVFVLNKIDLCDDVEAAVMVVREAIPDVPIFPVCALTEKGFEQIIPHVRTGQTAVMLGPSGVGKSTLINHLAQREVEEIGDVRESDSKGRHTTTHRHLIVLDTGGLVIDTPGIREMQVGEAAEGLEDTFEDINANAAACRFGDCRHEEEPGCAVREAVARGEIGVERFAHFLKLRAEIEQAEESREEAERRRKDRDKQIGRARREVKRVKRGRLED